MKKLFVLIAALNIHCAFLIAEPLIVIVAMVKNEAAVITATLEPYAKAGIQDFLIYDTGSTDKTIAVTQTFFQGHKTKHAYVEQGEFVDFATSRNRALELAEKRFPNADFFLFIDAEWYITGVPELISFCKQHCHETEPVYLIRITDNNTDFYTTRLIRRSAHPRFTGVVHEMLDQKAKIKAPASICFTWNPSAYGNEKTKKRWERDIKLLTAAHTKDPKNLRTLFFLAQTYHGLGNLKQAYAQYEHYTQISTDLEETYLALYRLGILADELSKQDTHFTWAMARDHYLTAYMICPHRAEPLVELARHYYNTKELPLCYIFARRAAELDYPQAEYFCVEKQMYDFVRYDLLGACALSVGDYERGEWALKKALEARPQAEYLRKNLQKYRELRHLRK
jgi:hypothetical protein